MLLWLVLIPLFLTFYYTQIGNWSRWLSDLFDIDDNDSPEVRNEDDGKGSAECETTFKAFHLLHSLSDLMMLPFEMLADASQRKEVERSSFLVLSLMFYQSVFYYLVFII